MQQIYNTQTHKKEPFVTLKPGEVKMYVCGPTVYGLLHVGNFRGPVFFNLVRNWLEKNGYKVQFVYNYTDVDDRIIKKAIEEKVTSSEISERYISEFKKDFATLKLKTHSANPKVTEFIPQIVQFIETLVQNGKAYVAEQAGGTSDVNYSIDAFKEYGKLSGRNPEELQAGARVDVNEKKKNPLDFVLWKGAKPGEPSWDSPWGKGRPGWHIECSAMIRSLLGDQIDIHGGGSDLIFPHHENEVAQSEGATGKPFVKYWMHNSMLNFGSQKMSKSIGNIRALRDFTKDYSTEIYKFLILGVHYRSILDFSKDGIDHSLSALGRIYSAMAFAEKILSSGVTAATTDEKFATLLKAADGGIAEALNDDFSTPEVFARVFEVIRQFNTLTRQPGKTTPAQVKVAELFLQWLKGWGEMMSLFQEPAQAFLQELDNQLLMQKNLSRTEIQQLVDQRTQARASKNFAESDKLRDELTQKGILLFDSPAGTQWEVQK